MDLTPKHLNILGALKRLRWATIKQLAIKTHPAAVNQAAAAARARVGKTIADLEDLGLVECSNPDTNTWKLTKEGLALVTPKDDEE